MSALAFGSIGRPRNARNSKATPRQLQQNTDRIQTTHIGSLPRPHRLLDVMKAKYSGQAYGDKAFGQALRSAVADGVREQVDCGAQRRVSEIARRNARRHLDFRHRRVGGVVYRLRRSRPTMPCGRNVTISTKMMPSHNSQRSG